MDGMTILLLVVAIVFVALWLKARSGCDSGSCD